MSKTAKIFAALIISLATLNIHGLVNAQETDVVPGFGIVTPEWVAKHANDPNVRILDVRPDMKEYFMAHVPNAVYIADAAFRGPKSGVPVQYWSQDMLSTILRESGVTNNSTVVVYSDGENVLGATMVAYILDRIGQKNVKIMDGGFTEYKASQKTAQEYPKYKPGKLTVNDNRKIGVGLSDIRAVLNNKTVTFVDARPGKVYQGETNIWMRNGHIPGAINVEWRSLVVEENPHKFKSIDEIKKIFTSKGITPDKNLIVYCGTSREVSLEYLLLKHVLKYPNVRLYEGSWTEYANTDLPLEKGEVADPRVVL